jgi:hypothetical protein
MKHILLGGLAGGVILFVWGFLAWTVLPLHNASLRPIENEDRVTEVLSTNIGAHGVYKFPANPAEDEELSAEEQQLATDEWMKKMQHGPTGMIIYDPHGTDPMMSGQMLSGFIINLVSALFTAWLLSRSTALTGSFLSRVAYCGVLGILISVSSHLMNWNWLGFPLDYTSAMVTDTVISWLLAGLGIAAIVRAPGETAAA